jgi:hypothetical protein
MRPVEEKADLGEMADFDQFPSDREIESHRHSWVEESKKQCGFSPQEQGKIFIPFINASVVTHGQLMISHLSEISLKMNPRL